MEMGSGVDIENQRLDNSFIDEAIIVYKFKVDGMTCVACSSAIEKGLTSEFKDRGLVMEADNK